jgi:hypothetical protein
MTFISAGKTVPKMLRAAGLVILPVPPFSAAVLVKAAADEGGFHDEIGQAEQLQERSHGSGVALLVVA